MTPFYFGTPERRLFAVYDPAIGSTGKVRAAVLCHPSGDEYVHAYRTMRQLAQKLSSAGTHVLRFDYYGTGDSAGDTGTSSMSGWCDDIETAIAELKDMTQAVEVSLLGLRRGANMAARIAAQHPREITSVVLWDPLNTVRDFRFDADPADDFEQFDLSRLADKLPARTLVVLTEATSTTESFGKLTSKRLPGQSPWIETRVETGTVPTEALQHIVDWMT